MTVRALLAGHNLHSGYVNIISLSVLFVRPIVLETFVLDWISTGCLLIIPQPTRHGHRRKKNTIFKLHFDGM